MKPPLLKQRTFVVPILGRAVVVYAGLSSDGWQWTADNACRHTDLASLVLFRRTAEDPTTIRMVLGPLLLMVGT